MRRNGFSSRLRDIAAFRGIALGCVAVVVFIGYMLKEDGDKLLQEDGFLLELS